MRDDGGEVWVREKAKGGEQGGDGGARVGDRWLGGAESYRPRGWTRLQGLITSRRPHGGAGALCKHIGWQRPPRLDRSTI